MSSNTIADHQRLVLVFSLDKEQFGFEITKVREVIEYPEEVTKVPLTPPFLHGIINLRGSVVPVVDLSWRFWGRETVIQKRTGIVIVELEWEDHPYLMGILVDSVLDVLEVQDGMIQAPPSFGTVIHADYIEGILNRDHHFVILCNTGKVLSIDELSQLVQTADPEEETQSEHTA
jgi:purine-binding chemotaxis protein CheW